ncbi:MAG: OmpA family protein [Myxococcota bacterium]|nr:OmpA family protein [Myxococcota bacterium]
MAAKYPHMIGLMVTTLLCTSVGCGGRPTEEMSAAERALSDGALSERCAPEEYRAAQRMYAKAEKYAEAEEYSKAKAAAKAAEQIAKKAQAKALARKEECLKAPQPTDAASAKTDDDRSNVPSVTVTDEASRLATVYFTFNAFKLDADARAIVSQNADILRDLGTSTIMLAGHCDHRGSTEYNLALGEKRAQAVRQYLISMGIGKDQVAIMSYGEENLADYGETEAAHAKNRRVEFSVPQQ